MKLKRHTSIDQKRAELAKVKYFMEIGIFILAAIEIFCELFDVQYVEYVVMSISFVECGLFVYGHLLNIRINRSMDFSAQKYDDLVDFHNTFMTSIIVPLIFIFTNNNTSFQDTRITDFALLQRITVLVCLAVLLYYKLVHHFVKKMAVDALTDEQKKRCDRRATRLCIVGTCMDAAVEVCVGFHFLGMLNKEETLTIFSALFAFLVLGSLVFLNRIEEKKPIFKISFLVFTVLYICFGTYNIYLEKSVVEIQMEQADYCFVIQQDDGKREQYCRFEDGANGEKILKYVIVHTDTQGKVTTGRACYAYTAVKPAKGLLKWYDTNDGGYIYRNDLPAGETPAVLSVSREKTESDDGFPLAKALENDPYAYEGEFGDEREWMATGDDHIMFRQTMLTKTATIPETVEKIFNEMH